MRSYLFLAVLGAVSLNSAFALERTRLGLVNETESSLMTGLEYKTGDYGTPDTTRVWSIPLNYSYRRGQYGLFASVSYLSAESTGDEIIVDSKMTKKKAQQTATTTGSSASGFGDIVVAGTYYFPTDYKKAFSYRATGILKLGTADESEGLGTGETDVAFEGGAVKVLDEYKLAFTFGYEINGDSRVYEYNDVFYGSVGLTRQLLRKRQVGGAVYVSEAVTPGGDEPLEISGFYRHPLSQLQDLYFYAGAGLSDASPDFMLGGLIQIHF
jgi:hypothetical protein